MPYINARPLVVGYRDQEGRARGMNTQRRSLINRIPDAGGVTSATQDRT